MSSNSIGSAAAMNALKQHQQGGGVGGQNQFIGMAMAEASKLFDQQSGGQGSGANKQSAIQSAAMQAVKMYMGAGSSGSSSGGGLMSLASKFL